MSYALNVHMIGHKKRNKNYLYNIRKKRKQCYIYTGYQIWIHIKSKLTFMITYLHAKIAQIWEMIGYNMSIRIH